MLKTIKINYDTIELLQFFWETAAKNNKVNDTYIMEIVNHPSMKSIYTDGFDEQSARKVLSAVINHEPVNEATDKELEFYHYNKFNADDPGNVEMMLPPIKQLNLDELKEEFNQADAPETLVVNFVPAYNLTSITSPNELTINFFKIEADWSDFDHVFIEGTEFKQYVLEQARKVLSA